MYFLVLRSRPPPARKFKPAVPSKPMYIANNKQYVQARKELEALEGHLHSLRPNEQRRLFELQKACYEYLENLPRGQRNRLLEKEQSAVEG
jgi:hypothetical protein